MSSWVNRTILSGSSTDRNGTNSHTCTFTPATSGNLLVAIVAGGVTFTTPIGWTRSVFAVNFSGIYSFTKTASEGESSFTTTHNGSDYPILGVVYEFYAGSSLLSTSNTTGQARNTTVTGPQVTGLSSMYTQFAARSWCLGTGSSSGSCTWTLPSIEDYDDFTSPASTDGIVLSIAYDDRQTASSFNPSSTLTTDDNKAGEGIAFALSITAPPSSSSEGLAWLKF